MDQRSANQIFSNGLRLVTGRNSGPGPIAVGAAVASAADLRLPTVAYLQQNGKLSGIGLNGKLRSLQRLPATPQQSSGWSSVPRQPDEKFAFAITSFFNSITPTGIIIHHSAVLPSDGAVPPNLQAVDQYHRQLGMETVCGGQIFHVAYHYVILPNGQIRQGRPEHCQGAHAQGYNTFLGISVFGDFSSKDNPKGKKGPRGPTAKQLRSLRALCSRLRAQYNIPLSRVVRHRDVAQTQCPGNRFPFREFMRSLARTSHARPQRMLRTQGDGNSGPGESRRRDGGERGIRTPDTR
jgi:N-acetylmuramoyl-L-alanine amidase